MVIELEKEVSELLSKLTIYKSIIIIPVLCDTKKHVLNNKLSFLFIKPLDIKEYYILPFDHNECLPLNIDILSKINVICDKIYTLDKKILSHVYKFSNVIDIKTLYYMKHNKLINLEASNSRPISHLLIEKEYSNSANLNKSFPILKFYEYLSSGKPVVSSKLPELIQYQDLCYLATDKEDYLQKIEIALNENNPKIRLMRIEFAKTNTWDVRVEELLKLMNILKSRK